MDRRPPAPDATGDFYFAAERFQFLNNVIRYCLGFF
jgi:hypothetical protein